MVSDDLETHGTVLVEPYLAHFTSPGLWSNTSSYLIGANVFEGVRDARTERTRSSKPDTVHSNATPEHILASQDEKTSGPKKKKSLQG